ncbi:MAG: CDP-diacylglycerol--serine O-phosphatidyltransferase [Desulfovibrionaceae bacterium]
MERKAPPHKGVYILPNMITTLSLFSGFLGILWSIAGDFEAAGMAILFAALMDGLDGKVARLTNTASEFGVQYDSLADLVAFGVSPALLMWQWQLHSFGRLGIAIAFIFMACGALRLARFNVSTAVTSKKFFIGMPIPAAGCSLVTLVFFKDFVPAWGTDFVPAFALGLTLLMGILMVSRVRYVSFKEYGFLKAHPFSSMVTVLLIFSLVASQPKLLGFLLCMGYMLSGLLYTFIILPRRNRELLRGLSLQD